ncbi:MAG: translation elongation factor Ts [Candidatus Pelagibacterales bacterium]|tara:strand:- start:12589 stop:13419 length:831 start_codon:yes stop_codon:yes gene_type:complete
MSVTAKQVQDLRKMSGAGMMDCKAALAENNADIDLAFQWLREKGIAKAQKKSTRDANEGLVSIMSNASGTAIVEVNSETDFVSRNNDFHSLVKNITKLILESKNDYNSVKDEISSTINDAIGVIGENIVFKRSNYIEGNTYSYVHNSLGENLGKIGVILTLETETDIDLKDVGKNLCMHIAASSPKSLDENSLDSDVIENEKSIIKEQLKESGKPDDIVEKMLDGKMNKFFEEVVLLNQKYVIDPSLTISKLLDNVGNEKGTKVNISSFTRYELGQ